MYRWSCALVCALLAVVEVDGHARWKCPAPRDENDADGEYPRFTLVSSTSSMTLILMS
jgi:hypothetical protein